MEGLIIKNISNDYLVKSEDRTYLCKPRGKFRYHGLSPLVGDFVSFDEDNGYLLSICKRKNVLIRPSVANVDQAIVVASVKMPDFDSYLLDKLLTVIGYHGIKPIICFTKLDLLSSLEREKIRQYMDYYQKIGYEVFDNDDIDGLKHVFKDKITVLTGQSGAGKSSLLNRISPDLNLKTNEISRALNRGKHTTRHTELFEVMEGYIVDTPGFSNVDFHGMDKYAIRDNMNEMFSFLENCKYRDCMHIKEDGCYVKKMVDEGVVLKSRYDNYVHFIDDKEGER